MASKAENSAQVKLAEHAGQWLQLETQTVYDVPTLQAEEEELQLQRFTSAEAWEVGLLLKEEYDALRRAALSSKVQCSKGIAYSIVLVDGTVLFQATAGTGVALDNMEWLKRKSNTVKRFGCSSYLRGQSRLAKQRPLDDPLLGPDYAAHGGAIPIRIRGVENPIGVVAVSGLTQTLDHCLAVHALRTVQQRQETQ